MRVGIVVNVLASRESSQTTYRLAMESLRRGHETWLTTAGRFAADEEEPSFLGRTAPLEEGTTHEEWVAALGARGAREEWVSTDELDVLLLRNNPSAQQPWAQRAGVEFGALAAQRGTLVLNDPDGLGRAMNKLYLQGFPAAVRPRTLVTRDSARIEAFVREEGKAILKPLQGSGGKGVFLVEREGLTNLSSMVRSIERDGYVIAQEYLPKAVEGDTRVFLLNGALFEHDGRPAVVRRVRTGDDIRSNVHVGGKIRRAQLTDEIRGIVEQVGPKLRDDGMFFVGLDVVGDKLMEINIFSPGGLGSAGTFEKADFFAGYLDALEGKVARARENPERSNAERAVL